MIRLTYPEGQMAVCGELDRTGEIRGRVLVVEDDPSSRRALVLLLKLRGFETIFAGSIKEGIDQIRLKPGCILLDLMLPDGNGGSILDYVHTHHLPIRVAVTTGAGNWQTLLANVHSQPDRIFTKPLDFGQVVDWLTDSSSCADHAGTPRGY